MQYLVHILIILIWFEVRIQMLLVVLLHYKKRLWELTFPNQGIVIQVLYFQNLSYLNSLIKSFLKMCFWLVNLSILFVFNNWFAFCSNTRYYETTLSATCKLFKPSFRTFLHGRNSITVNATDAWNKAQSSLGETILKDLTLNKIKTITIKRMTDSY